MSRIIIAIVIAVVIVLIQSNLSKLKHWAFGGILPLFMSAFTIWCFFFRVPKLGTNMLVPFVILFLILLGMWGDGREKLKKEQKKELEKMKAYDLDE